MKNSYLIVLLIAYALSIQCMGQNQIGWPDVSNEMKPWTRWWWLGSSVDQKNLSKALESYAKVGLGGTEITPIYGVRGMENQFITYTSPEWMEKLCYTLSECKKFGLGVDLALASGWPFGGPWVSPDDACKYIEFKTFYLPDGGYLKDKISLTQKPIIRTVGKSISVEQLKCPVALNDSLEMYAIDQVRFAVQLPLIVLMAYSAEGDTLDLTGEVDSNGNLNHKFTGKGWTLVAGFMGWHGKQVERAGPGAEGDVIDHFSKSALNNYLKHFDESFTNHNISGLRAFFNDSYEVDDAWGESNFTPDFFNEFEKYRAYDLKKYLSVLTQETTDTLQLRLLCDYRETISDMLLQNYTIPWQKWSAEKGKIIRNQSHGSPANILDLYAASDIPETEGTDLLNIKFASSAAHVSGKKLIAAEACTWLNEHFLETLTQAKENVDQYFIGGVNHIVYHGTPYSPANADWPGWMFYASTHFAPSNPLWNDFYALNTYVTRVQSFLQLGNPDNDILLYFPIYDQWMEKGKSWLHHFHGANSNSEVYKLALELQKKGYSFDFISDKQIGNLECSEGILISEGKSVYKTILLPPMKFIPVKTFSKLISLAQNGAKLIFMGKLPNNVPGFGNLENNKAELERLKKNLSVSSENNGVITYSVGKGRVLVGKDYKNTLKDLGIEYENIVDSGFQFIRFNYKKTKTYFITNWSGKALEKWIPFTINSNIPVLYNPVTGEYGKAKFKIENEKTLVLLKLQYGESCMIQFCDKAPAINNYNYWRTSGNGIALNSKWSIRFINGGPVIPNSLLNIELGSWEGLNQNTRFFSGSAVYSCQFSMPDINCDAWKLTLGEVHESARIKLNGVDLGSLIGPDYSLVIDKKLVKKNNKIEIFVSNLMANRIIYMDMNNIPYRKFYNTNFNAKLKNNQGTDGKFSAKNWEIKKSGLSGPVIFIPLVKE